MEININATYRACLAHYGTAALPARPRRPRDKGKAELEVQIAQRWILFRLRNHVFFDSSELNAELGRLMAQLNEHLFKKLPGCRAERFELGERESLMSLPSTAYEAEDLRCGVRVGRDHHVEHEGGYYSEPSEAAGQRVDIRFTENVLEVLTQGRRLTLHPLSKVPGDVTTLDEHGPIGNLRVLEGEPLALANWAKQAAPGTRDKMLYHLEKCTDTTNGHRTARRLHDLARAHGRAALRGGLCICTRTQHHHAALRRADFLKTDRTSFLRPAAILRMLHTTTSAVQATSGVRNEQPTANTNSNGRPALGGDGRSPDLGRHGANATIITW